MVVEIFIKVKHLIKKILREGDDAFNDSRETGGNEIESRVRDMMRRLQKIPNLEVFVDKVKQEGFHRGYYGSSSDWVLKITKEIAEIPKLFGGENLGGGEKRNNFVWMAVTTFINNGGYQRDFSDTNDPLDLRPITVYEVDALYSQPMKEYGTTWGITYGASNDQEAGEMYMDHPHTWETDREHDDTDDYGDTDVYEIGKVDDIKLEFTKGILGVS